MVLKRARRENPRPSRFPRSTFDKAQLGGAQVALDADRLGARVQVRSLRPGDRFQPLGMEGHKKLSDFLIDAKWPKISRDEVLVLTQGEEIAWVAPPAF